MTQRVGHRLVCCLLSAVCCLSATAQGVTNPVWEGNWPDPTVWREGSTYYALATNPQRMLRSDDLFRWTMAENQPIDDASWQTMRSQAHHFWAPDVTTVHGRRLLYLTLYNSAEDCRIAVLRQEADGMFHYQGIITDSRQTGIDDTIDPEVVTDGRTGRVWLFFGSVGGMHRVRLRSDGLSLYPGARYEHVAGLTVRQDPSRSKVFEGAYVHRRGRWWYLFVSAGHFGDHSYRLLVGRSKKLTGTFRDRQGRPMTEGQATPVIGSQPGDHFYGPGHCGEIFTAANGLEYIFYHCHNTSTRPGSRPMMMQQIRWDSEGWPYVEGGKPCLNVTPEKTNNER